LFSPQAGKAGGGTRYVLNPGTSDELLLDHKIDALSVKAGDRLLAITPGGGGWGDPLEREPEIVAEDYRLGLISAAAARDEYGVIVAADGSLDLEATDRRRHELRDQRGPLKVIDRGSRSNTAVELRTSNGNVEVYGMQQSGKVRTSNGKIVLDQVSGDFNIVTSNGGVTIAGAIGSFDVETSNGRIKFDGELASGSSNKMTTSNGSVEIKLQGTPSVKLNASTSNGSIDTEYPILTSSPGDKHRLVGTIGAGEAVLLVRTSNGSVVIR